LAIFLTGLFWKSTTNKAAIFGILISIPIAMYFKVGPNNWVDSSLFVTLPFMNQMMWTFCLTLVVIVLSSYLENKGSADPKKIELSKNLFETQAIFNIGAFAVLIICAFLYAFFW